MIDLKWQVSRTAGNKKNLWILINHLAVEIHKLHLVVNKLRKFEKRNGREIVCEHLTGP